MIVVARGGGSAEDLAAYNTETVARVVFSTRRPYPAVATTDFTLCDLPRMPGCDSHSGGADGGSPTPKCFAKGYQHLEAYKIQGNQRICEGHGQQVTL